MIRMNVANVYPPCLGATVGRDDHKTRISGYPNPGLNQILIRIYRFAFYVTSDLQIFLMYGKINYFIIMKI
jgi:hypothetical protein